MLDHCNYILLFNCIQINRFLYVTYRLVTLSIYITQNNKVFYKFSVIFQS